MGNRNQEVTTMGEILEGIAPTSMREILEAAEWKEGDKVPKGYKVVFGRLAKIGGKTVPVADGGGGTSAAPSKGAPAKKFHTDMSPKELGLFGDESKHSNDRIAAQAAKDINGTIHYLADWATKNKERLNKSNMIDRDDEHFITSTINDMLSDNKAAGATDTAVKEVVHKKAWDAIERALAAKD